MGGKKAAVSVTLDQNVLDFFSGKNRSAHINRILVDYLRKRLKGGEHEDPIPQPRSIFNAALEPVRNTYGQESVQMQIMYLIREGIKNEVGE